MSLISGEFALFAAVLVAAFYLVPKRAQWICLLVASCIFYVAAGWENGVFLVITALSAYGAGRWMQAIGEKSRAYLRVNRDRMDKAARKAVKAAATRRRRWVMGGLPVSKLWPIVPV